MDKYTKIKGLTEEESSGNGSKLALYLWRGEVTQAIKNIEDQIERNRVENQKNFCELREAINGMNGRIFESRELTNKELVDIKLTAAAEGAKNGQKWAFLIGAVTLIISILKDWFLKLFASQ